MKLKMTSAVSAALLLCLAMWPAHSHAGRRESLLGLARVLSYQKKYDESLARYDEYLSKYPRDMQAQLEAGDVAFWSGDYDLALARYEAVLDDSKLGPKAEPKAAEVLLIKGDFARSRDLYTRIIERNPSDTEAGIRLAELLSYEKRYGESVAQYDSILEREPGNIRAMRGRADVLSWAGRYDESVAAYDELLETEYDAEAARQRARVLGWARRYGESLAAYREASERTGAEAIWLEGRAKNAFWNSWPIEAISLYRELIEIEPDNAEARFDLGQTEGYERMWPDAAARFATILETMPSHFRAADSLERVETLWRMRELAPEFRWFRAKSDSRDADIDRYTTGFSFRQPAGSHMGINAGYYFDLFRFENAGSIPRSQGKIGLDFSAGPRIWGEAIYLPTGYPSDDRTSHLWSGSVSVRAYDQLVITAYTERDDLYNQRVVFDKRLRQTDVGGQVESRLHRRVTAYGGYRYRMVNDSNRQRAAEIEALLYLLYEPKRLTLDIRFDWQDWKRTVADYWSPDNFWHVSATLHWRHYLNPDGMYFGALNTYYGLKYRFQIDRDKRPFNGGAFELHRDWSRRMETSAEAFGNYSSVYWDLGVAASMTLRF